MQLLGQVCVSLLDEEPELLRDAHTTKARGNENWHGFQFILIGSRSRSRAPACPCSLVLYIYINLYVYIMYYRYLMTSSLCRTRQFPLFIGNVVYIYSPSGSASLIESWLVWYRRRGQFLEPETSTTSRCQVLDFARERIQGWVWVSISEEALLQSKSTR